MQEETNFSRLKAHINGKSFKEFQQADCRSTLQALLLGLEAEDQIEPSEQQVYFCCLRQIIENTLNQTAPSQRSKKNLSTAIQLINKHTDADSLFNDKEFQQFIRRTFRPTKRLQQCLKAFDHIKLTGLTGEPLLQNGKQAYGASSNAYLVTVGKKSKRVLRKRRKMGRALNKLSLEKNLPQTRFLATPQWIKQKADFTKYHKGGSVSELSGGDSPEIFWPAALSMIEGLMSLQAQGITHLDIKLENVFYANILTTQGQTIPIAAIGDFDGAQEQDKFNFRKAQITPHYSPNVNDFQEAMNWNLEYSTKEHDVYSLLITLLCVYSANFKDFLYNDAQAIEASFRNEKINLTINEILDPEVQAFFLDLKHLSGNALNRKNNITLEQPPQSLADIPNQWYFTDQGTLINTFNDIKAREAAKWGTLKDTVPKQSMVNTLSRCVQALLVDAEKMSMRSYKTSLAEKSAWLKRAKDLLEKYAEAPDHIDTPGKKTIPIRPLIESAYQTVCFSLIHSSGTKAAKAHAALQTLKTQVAEKRNLRGLHLKGQRISTALRYASKEDTVDFFTAMITTLQPNALRKFLQQERFQQYPGCLEDALIAFINKTSNPQESESDLLRILIVLRAFQKYMPRALSTETEQSAKEKITTLLQTSLDNTAMDPGQNITYFNFFNPKLSHFFDGSNASLPYRLLMAEGSIKKLYQKETSSILGGFFCFFNQHNKPDPEEGLIPQPGNNTKHIA